MDGVDLANSICDTFQIISDTPLPAEDYALNTPPSSPTKGERSITSLDHAAKTDPTNEHGSKRPVDNNELSPAGKAPSKQPRRHLSFPGRMQPAPAPTPAPQPSFESLSSLIQASLQANANTVANFTSKFDEKTKADDERFAKLHGDIKTVIDDHSHRLDDHEARITAVENLAADLQRKLDSFAVDSVVRSQPSHFSPREDPSFSQQGSSPAPPLSFSTAARSDVDQRIQMSREAEAQNAKSLVIFHARPHIGDLTEQEFAERVVGLFDGKHAKVVAVEWIGQGLIHLRVTLDQPKAEEIGRSFWQNARTYQVRYSLAPCRGVVLREAINRMRAVLEALRRYSELAGRRVHATSARFIGTDSFDAHKFLYPAIRLSDDRIIPISQILNNPMAPLSFTPNPDLDIPGPDAAFRPTH
jgi:hypothetical protein